MILSDFLSRQKHEDSKQHDIIPIPLNMHNILHERYYNLGLMDKYSVQTWSQKKSSGILLPEVHGIKKILDRNSPPEKQKIAPQVKKGSEIKPRLGKGRVGIKCKNPVYVTDKLQEILKIPAIQNIAINKMDFPMHEQPISNSKTETITQGLIQNINREIPFYPDLIYMPPPKPTENLQWLRIESKEDVSPRIDVEFEENLPYQEGIISKTYQRPDKSYFQELKELENLVNTGRLVQKFFPKQAGIDKILKIIQWEILKGTHLPMTIKGIQAGYQVSSHFKDIYLCLPQNKLPSNKMAIKKVEALAEKYILLDSLFFKIVSNPDREAAVLAIPEVCGDKIITLYHSSLFKGHQGVIKTYLTINNIFIPNLIHYLHSYI